MELGFQIAIVSGISDSLSCISDSKARNPDSKSKKFLHFGFSYTWPRREIRLSRFQMIALLYVSRKSLRYGWS